MAAYHIMLKRMNKLPLNEEDKNKELNTISIANNNGYVTKWILHLNNKSANGPIQNDKTQNK
jgi:hypothetical protein